jgi:hypothetical protein
LVTCLTTIAGEDQRTSELLGWGWLHADLARRVSAAQHASWWYVLTEVDGTTLDVGPVRRRPAAAWAPAGPAPTYRNVEVWLQVTRAELTALLDHPPPGWAPLIVDIANRVAHRPGGPPNADPTDRFPNVALRRWIHIRDRHCTFVGCRVGAHQGEIDHSHEHAKGGPTIDANLGAACGSDHALHSNHGWRVRQPAPGTVIWTSPLGHDYRTAPPPRPHDVLPPMPDPTRAEDLDDPPTDSEWDRGCIVYLPAPRPRPAPMPKTPAPQRDYGEPPF